MQSKSSKAAFVSSMPVKTPSSLLHSTTEKTNLKSTKSKRNQAQRCKRRGVIRNAVASPPPPTSVPSRYSSPQQFPPSIPIVGMKEFEMALKSHSSDKPVVILFHARWCRTCKTLRAKIPSLADQFPSVQWYDVDFAMLDNKPLCVDLGVKLLPTFRIYTGGANKFKYDDEFLTGPFDAPKVVEHLNLFFQSHPNVQM